MRQQKLDMLDMKEDIKNTIIHNINEKFKNLETKNEQLEQKIETQKLKIDNFEKFIRRKNLLIFGVEEHEKSYHELEEKVLNIISKKLNIKCEHNNIESVRRLGKKSNKIRPIVITLATMGLKIQIQKNKKMLDTTPYYIKEDYPLEVLNKRKELQIEVEEARKQGKKAIIKYDKLVILDNKHQNTQFEKIKNNNKKRNLSESPETTTNPTDRGKQNKSKPSKINKTNTINNFIINKPTHTFPEKTPPQAHCSNKSIE